MALSLEFSQNAADYYRQSIEYKQQNNLNNAVICLQKAINLEVDNYQYHHELGEIFTRQNNLDKAVGCYRQAIALKPDFFWSYHYLASNLLWQHQYAEALVIVKKAIVLNDAIAATHNLLGKILFELGKVEPAIKAYSQALELEPELAIAHYNLGCALSAKGQLQWAINAYKKSLEYNPNFFWSYVDLAQALIRQNNYSLAIKYCHRALKNQSTLNQNQIYQIYFTIADALIEQRNIKALERLLIEVDCHIQDFFFYLVVGQKLAKLEQFDLAISFLTKAKQLIEAKRQSNRIPIDKYALKLEEIKYSLACLNAAKDNKSLVAKHQYKIVSLGFNCVPRRVATVWGLKPRKSQGELTCPFDLAVHDYQSVVKAISTDFDRYLNPEDLIPFTIQENTDNDTKFTCIKNTYYDNLFSHQRDEKYREHNFARLIALYEQRIQNFYQYLQYQPILFILHAEHPINTDDLFQVLSSKFPQLKFKLMLIVSSAQIISPRLAIDNNLITYYAPCVGTHLWSTKCLENIPYERGIAEAIKQVILQFF